MPTDKRRIQAYVSPTTYQMIQGQAEAEGISVSEAAARILNTYLGDPSTASVSQVDMSQYVTKQEFEVKIAAILTQMGRMQGDTETFFATMQEFWVEGMERVSKGKSLKEGKKYQALKGI